MAKKINLNDPDILEAKEASKIWGHAENYVRLNPNRFPEGTIRKFGTTWVVTVEGMEAVTGKKDPRRQGE